MSTPAGINLIDRTEGRNNVHARIMRHADGYPSWAAKDIAEYLLSGDIVNGLHLDGKRIEWNGFEDFAAAYVVHLKDGPGGIYLNAFEGSSWFTAYVYDVVLTDDGWLVEVYEGTQPDDSDRGEQIFAGGPKSLLKKIKQGGEHWD